jgi:hypothetical protein
VNSFYCGAQTTVRERADLAIKGAITSDVSSSLLDGTCHDRLAVR